MIYLVDLPSPIHGMAVMNKAFVDKVTDDGHESIIINTAPSYAASLYNDTVWAWVLIKFFHTIFCYIKLSYYLFSKKYCTVYRSLNGGWGQLYDVLFMIIARLFNCKIFIHHHSFKYLNRKSKLFYVINKLSGKSTVHIVLADPMKTLLCNQYAIEVGNVSVLSNLALLSFVNQDVRAIDNQILKIGFLSNCSLAKGIDVFLDICCLLKTNNISFSAEIAGPIDNKTLKLISPTIEQNNNITYVGSLYEEEKYLFYKQLDCFIFPSKYEHEAEPVVLYEAASCGSLLIASKKGAIEHVLSNLSGIAVSSNNTANIVTQEIIDSVHNNIFNYSSRVQRKKLFEDQKQVEESSVIGLMKKFKKVS